MSGTGAKRRDAVVGESLTEPTMEELREFLEADLLDVRATPEFMERLRRKLWKLLQERRRERSDTRGDGA